MSTLNPKPRIYSKELFVRDRLQAFKTYPNMDPDFKVPNIECFFIVLIIFPSKSI